MKNNLLNNYISQRLNSSEKHLITYRKNKHPEEIHALRVEIKKIKAILSFAQRIYKVKYSCRILQTAYKKAGEIREFQINRELLSKLKAPSSPLLSYLKTRQHTLERQFTKHIPEYLAALRKFRTKINLPEELPKKGKLKKYFSKRIRKADKKLMTKDREQLHLFRKKVKEILYVNNALPKKLQKSIGIDPQWADKLQRQTGDWHDIYSAIYFFSQHRFPVSTVKCLSQLRVAERKQFKTLTGTSFILQNNLLKA